MALHFAYRLLIILVLSWAVFCSSVSGTEAFQNHEGRLRTALSSNYMTEVRPSQTTSVYINLLPISLNELNVGYERMSVTAVVFMAWIDPRLAWDPSEYGMIGMVAVQPSSIWKPTVIVENAVSDIAVVGGGPSEQMKALVRSSGLVFWYPPIDTTVYCDIKISQYPFDTQNCSIRITPAGEPSSMVSFSSDPTDFFFLDANFNDQKYFSESGEWDLSGRWNESKSFDDNIGGRFNRIDFFFSFRRKWKFHLMNLVLPLILMSGLMCGVFFVPIDSGERLTYCLTVLLSYIVFLTWINGNLPAVSNDLSILQIYVVCVLMLGIGATFLTIWVLRLHRRDPSQPISKAVLVFLFRRVIPCLKVICLPRASQSTPNSSREQLELGQVNISESSELPEPFTNQEVAHMYNLFIALCFVFVTFGVTGLMLDLFFVHY